jgi:hypothetical protein
VSGVAPVICYVRLSRALAHAPVYGCERVRARAPRSLVVLFTPSRSRTVHRYSSARNRFVAAAAAAAVTIVTVVFTAPVRASHPQTRQQNGTPVPGHGRRVLRPSRPVRARARLSQTSPGNCRDANHFGDRLSAGLAQVQVGRNLHYAQLTVAGRHRSLTFLVIP